MRQPDERASATAAAERPQMRGRLFGKYVALFATVVCVALLANGLMEVWFSYQEHKASLVRIQREQALAAAAKIERFVNEIQNQIGWTTQLPWSSAASVEQRRFDAIRLLRQVPPITEIAELDPGGHEQVRVSRLAMDVVGSGADFSKDPKFTEAVANKVYYGPIYFRRESEPYMTLALAGARREAGVTVAEVNLKFIWDVVSQIKVGRRGDAFVVGAAGRLIAHPDISLVLRNTDLSHLAQVQAAQAGRAGEVQEATDIEGHRVLTAFAPVDPLGWLVFVELPADEAYAPLYASIERSGLVLAGALGLAVLAGMLLARRMIIPIRALGSGATRIGAGDLSQRISVKTGDELEALADQFNAMAGQLQESYADLEKKVDVRTRELTEALEQQTATSEVLRVISSSPGELEPVFQTILASATRICEAHFGMLYRMVGDEFRVEATRDVPPAYAEFLQGQRQLADARNALGRLLLTRQPVHIPDLKAEPAYLEHEPVRVATVELAGARSYVVVPMLKEQELIGGIAIYRTEIRPFTEKQIALLTSFASQAVIAIENARLLTELHARTDELSESLRQQTATTEVLKVISRSPTDTQPVFDTIVRSAVQLCGARFGVLHRFDGERLHLVAHDVTPEMLEIQRRAYPMPPSRLQASGRAILDRAVVEIPDAQEDPEYQRDMAAAGDYRGVLAVPMLRADGSPIGTIAVLRKEPGAFATSYIEMLKTFADQAVIAIENVRLFNELRSRTDELTEALKQQTATSEVLRVISSSPGELDPVFTTILANATRICDAHFAILNRYEGGLFRTEGIINMPADYAEYRRRTPARPDSRNTLGRLLETRQPVHVADITTERAYAEGEPTRKAIVELAGARTLLAVPMLKEGEVIGAIVIFRKEVRPFSDKQITLVVSFANQAVIAIENARLLTELRARTQELTESLEQQTATTEVLKVINRSPTDAQPVFDMIVRSAVQLTGAQFGVLHRFDGGQLQMAAHNVTPAMLELLQRAYPMRPSRSQASGRAILDCAVAEIRDVLEDPDYQHDMAVAANFRSLLAVPMLRADGSPMGAIVVQRSEPGPFAARHIEMLKTFADQAVIAVENVRLFNEVQARTEELARSVEELRALGEVGQAINSTLDIETVLSTIVAKAVQLSATDAGAIYVFDETMQEFRIRATHGMTEAMIAAMRDQHLMREDTVVRAVTHRAPIQIPDLLGVPSTPAVDVVLGAGYRALLVIPLLRPDRTVGILVVRRRQPGAFPENIIDLLQTFAAQSVLAIQNARLFHEIEEKGHELEMASRHKSQFLANMSHELRTPLNAVLGYTELILDDIYGDIPDKVRSVLDRVQSNGRHLLGLINDVLDLSKIEAGQLTLSLSDYSLQSIVQTVVVAVESLATEKQLALKVELPVDLPPGRGDERRLSQVLLNLVGNAIKFTDAGEVAIAASAANGAFTVAVHDTGPGIPEADQAKIFEEFHQVDNSSTRRKGGTGLGLSIARKIVELHGGRLWVESKPGQGSTFSFTVPVMVEQRAA